MKEKYVLSILILMIGVYQVNLKPIVKNSIAQQLKSIKTIQTDFQFKVKLLIETFALYNKYLKTFSEKQYDDYLDEKNSELELKVVQLIMSHSLKLNQDIAIIQKANLLIKKVLENLEFKLNLKFEAHNKKMSKKVIPFKWG